MAQKQALRPKDPHLVTPAQAGVQTFALYADVPGFRLSPEGRLIVTPAQGGVQTFALYAGAPGFRLSPE